MESPISLEEHHNAIKSLKAQHTNRYLIEEADKISNLLKSKYPQILNSTQVSEGIQIGLEIAKNRNMTFKKFVDPLNELD